MDSNTIPIIDLNDYYSNDTDRLSFIDNVGSALRDVGFFGLVNHGLSEQLVHNAYQLAGEFFAQDEAIKNPYEDLALKGQRGYTAFGREHAKNSNAPDLKEFWHVGQELDSSLRQKLNYPANIWPGEITEFKPVLLEVFSKLDSCALTILEACSQFVGEDPSLMKDMADKGNSILRVIHYPPIPEGSHPESIRAAAHEDINFITLLVNATSSGLELLDSQGEWMPVVTPKDTIIVDSGDMLQNLTNGYFKSTVHRVVNPDNARTSRMSMPFFAHAKSDVSLNPLESCIAKTGGKKIFPDITAGEFLSQRLKEIGLA